MMGAPKSRGSADRREGEEISAGSFPASDPPSATGIIGPRREKAEPSDRDERPEQVPTPHGRIPRREAEPRGQPTSERHRSETAHHPEHRAHRTERS